MHNFDEIIDRRGTDSVKWNNQTMKYSSNDLFPMWVADTEFKTDSAMLDALQQRVAHGIFGYISESEEAKEAIIAWHAKHNQITYAPESIGFAPSVLTSMQLLIHTMSAEGDFVMITLPTYGPFHDLTEKSNRQVLATELVYNAGQYTMDFAKIEADIIANSVKLFILCNPHNPTGRAWSADELTQLITICQKHNVFIISDEIHSDLIMPGAKFVPSLAIARKLKYEQQIAVINSPTKTFNLASIQTSYFVIESEAVRVLMAEKAAYFGVLLNVNVFGVVALHAAYTHGAAYVEALIPYIYGNYQYLVDVLGAQYPALQVSPLEATYLVWIDVTPLGVDEEVIQNALQAAGVAVQTKSDFFEEGSLHMRVNIATPRAQLEKGVQLILNGLAAL